MPARPVVSALLLIPLYNDETRIEVLGQDVPVWLVAFTFDALGVLAGAAAAHTRAR